jgi:hypothetical protein
MARHSRAIRARQAAALIDAKPGTFGSIGKRCEVAFLYDRGCVPSYLFTINGMQSILYYCHERRAVVPATFDRAAHSN